MKARPEGTSTGRTRLLRFAARAFIACGTVGVVLVALEGYFQFRAARERPWQLPDSPARSLDVTCEENCSVLRSDVPGLEYRIAPHPGMPWGYPTALPVPANGEALERDPRRIRIAVVGDSMAAGFGISDDEESFPEGLERCLAERRPPGARPVEVANFAVPGYNALDVHATIRHAVLRYRPDIIDYAFYFNDVTVHHSIEAGLTTDFACAWAENRDVIERGPGRIDRIRGWFRTRSALHHQLTSYRLPLLRHRVIVPTVQALGGWFPGLPDAHPYFRDAASHCRDHALAAVVLEDMIDLTDAHGIPLRITHLPRLVDLEAGSPDASADLLAWIARERPAVPILPLRPVFEEAVRRDALPWADLHIAQDRLHFSALGHRIAARALCEHYLTILPEGDA